MKIFKGFYDNPKEYDIRRTIVIAPTKEDARRIICSRFGLRKNAAGLDIDEIPYTEAQRVSSTKTELIPSTAYRPGLGHWDDSHYGSVTRHYCSKCKKEIHDHGDFCLYCGAFFTN